MNNRELDKFVARNLEKSNREIAEMLKKEGITKTPNSIRHRKRKFKKKFGQDFATIRESLLQRECEVAGIPMESVDHYWYKSELFSIHAKGNKATPEQLRDLLIESVKDHIPKYPTLKRTKSQDPHLLVVDIADLHIGKLAAEDETGFEYNIEIACTRAREGVQELLKKVQGFEFDKILFIIGNDIIHIDTPHRKTTSGTPQDTDGMWWQMYTAAQKLYIEIIETLNAISNVHVVHCPSNHDFTAGWYLAQTLEAWFKDTKNITFDVTPRHRKYFRYGNSLIGMTHGDGAKTNDLPSLMAVEAREEWAYAKFAYFYTHHIHHKERLSKDLIGVTIESLRSPSAPDSWHDRNGYVNQQAVECFVHAKEGGQIGRFTHWY